MRIDGLTPKQHRAAQLVADGLTDSQMAAQLHISAEGVGYLVRRIADAWSLDRTRNIRVQITRRVLRAAA